MTKTIGVLGWPVSHSLSPIMHNRAIEILNLDYRYLPFAVHPENLENAIKGVRGLGITGVNLTIPHKERVIPFLDKLSPQAEQAGAVNTVCSEDGRLVGHNTDGQGFIRSLKEEGAGDLSKKSFLLLGAGGAARGIGAALVSEGVKRVTISNRSSARANSLARILSTLLTSQCRIQTLFPDKLSMKTIGSFDIIINTTSVGMKKDDPELFDYNLISGSHIVCDIIYTPARTELLLAAERRGARSINGIGMLIHQGALSFELWTGCKMPVLPVKEMLLTHIEKITHGQD